MYRLLAVLQEDVEQDDADLVVCADVGVQQDGDDGPHRVLDLLPLGVGAHSQILKHQFTPVMLFLTALPRYCLSALTGRVVLHSDAGQPVPRGTACPLFPGSASCSPQPAAGEWSTGKNTKQNTECYYPDPTQGNVLCG